MLDFGHIHDILDDAAEDEAYSPEARQSAKFLRDALNALYDVGWKDGQADMKKVGA